MAAMIFKVPPHWGSVPYRSRRAQSIGTGPAYGGRRPAGGPPDRGQVTPRVPSLPNNGPLSSILKGGMVAQELITQVPV
jgi:hypothetical protein